MKASVIEGLWVMYVSESDLCLVGFRTGGPFGFGPNEEDDEACP